MWSLRNRPSDEHFKPVRRDAIVFLVSLVVLCALSDAIADALPQPGQTRISAGAAPSATPTPTDTPAPLPTFPVALPTPSATPTLQGAQVADPWAPGQPQLGVDVYWAEIPGESEQTVQAKVTSELDYVVSLGANAVSLSFPFVTTGVHADQVSADPATTPSMADLGFLLTQAKADGLYVALRPILNEDALVKQDANAWRGSIQPASVSTWFANYTQFLTPYAQLAQSTGTDTFYISTELTSMEGYSADWSALTTHLKSVYTGTLADSVNYDRLPANTPRIPGAQLGVDAYFPLTDLGDNATVPQLAAGWNHWLNAYSTGALTNLEISESGIVPYDGAYQAPFVWSPNGKVNENIQTSWYQAACQVAQTRHVAGLYWWYLDLEGVGDDDATADDPMSFYDTPAAQVVKDCFATYPR